MAERAPARYEQRGKQHARRETSLSHSIMVRPSGRLRFRGIRVSPHYIHFPASFKAVPFPSGSLFFPTAPGLV